VDAANLCEYLPWDSEFFGLRIGRVNANRLTPATAAAISEWCETNSIDCLYFLADSADPESVRLAEHHGFRLVDIRVTFEKQLGREVVEEKGGAAVEGMIRPSRPEDIPALRAIAGVSHHDTRFYFDPNFPPARRDALYETWIEKSCNGYADAVLVAEFDNTAVGYITCKLLGEGGGEGQIGLVGVAPEHQGKGLGSSLVEASLRWFAEHGIERVTVVTQGRNTAAQRLYQRCGFVTQSVQLWYHLWPHRG
jgi:dTDP-4-amino-4,6-dideoxy-D-galactose acyltransferase